MENALEGQQLLSLDAYSLLASRALQKRATSCCSSTPPSSLDLEWENENGLQNAANRPKSLPSSNVDDGGSSYSGGGGGSPESLEWDPCDPSGMDYETDQLIQEIELLTRRALQETGDWTKRGS
ncbi:hypothetical protein GE061_016797 [Apolygus lucorum]|uniref:Uncharacterized protein n=1 Tax=Apolygus lucorum TaxID=248454 RepID=A0A6A4JVH9_APOLU|nr:hypothetical protein GE061_016797 [Apolygus lucorum]